MPEYELQTDGKTVHEFIEQPPLVVPITIAELNVHIEQLEAQLAEVIAKKEAMIALGAEE